MGKWLTRAVLLLSLVSLLNDMAGEMLYPVLPLYLASIGYGAIWIGILEGIAEATSGLTKGWFGEWSDHTGRRLPFVRMGYFMSAVAKSALILIPSPVWAILMRTSDRLGKGIRTGARDAMLAGETDAPSRGKVFGFHRAFDTAGAVMGPLIALLWLAFHRENDFHPLFLFALVPGLLSVALLFLLREKRKEKKGSMPYSPLRSFSYWSRSSKEYRRLVAGIVLFALFNSSDMFLLLRVKELFPGGITLAGHPVTGNMLVVIFYIIYNFFYALLSYPAGFLSDKSGPKKMLITGYLFFVITYTGMAFLHKDNPGNFYSLVFLFFVYGLFSAFTEGVSRSWVSQLCGKDDKGKALGLFAAFTSMAVLVASVSAGVVWNFLGQMPVFLLPAAAAVLTIIYLTFAVKDPVKKNAI